VIPTGLTSNFGKIWKNLEKFGKILKKRAPLFLKKCELELELLPHERKLTLVAPSSGQN
jgi:hypothetical protein